MPDTASQARPAFCPSPRREPTMAHSFGRSIGVLRGLADGARRWGTLPFGTDRRLWRWLCMPPGCPPIAETRA